MLTIGIGVISSSHADMVSQVVDIHRSIFTKCAFIVRIQLWGIGIRSRRSAIRSPITFMCCPGLPRGLWLLKESERFWLWTTKQLPQTTRRAGAAKGAHSEIGCSCKLQSSRCFPLAARQQPIYPDSVTSVHSFSSLGHYPKGLMLKMGDSSSVRLLIF